MKTTGLSGHEIYCLDSIGYKAGDIVIGNSVHSLGFVGGIGSSLRAVVGGEIKQFTALIEDGRKTAYDRMEKEAVEEGAAAELFKAPKTDYTRALFAAAFNMETAPEGVVSQ